VPYRADRPAAGAPLVNVLGPNFLPANLRPREVGGEQYAGRFFADGSWQTSSGLYGEAVQGLGG
jgi:hypothetical protein